MKRFGIIFLMLFSACLCFAKENSSAQNTNSSVQSEKKEFTEFYGIKFATKKADVLKLMAQKGWQQGGSGDDKNFGDYLIFKNGIYSEKKLSGYDSITLFFYEDYFYLANLSVHIEKDMEKDKKAQEEKWVQDALKNVIDQYDLHEVSKSADSTKYTGTDNNVFAFILDSSKTTDFYYFRFMDSGIYLLKSMNMNMSEYY